MLSCDLTQIKQINIVLYYQLLFQSASPIPNLSYCSKTKKQLIVMQLNKGDDLRTWHSVDRSGVVDSIVASVVNLYDMTQLIN